MANDALKALVAQGLQAMRAGGEVAKRATAEIEGDASHPGLKSALQAGNKTSEQWTQRLGGVDIYLTQRTMAASVTTAR